REGARGPARRLRVFAHPGKPWPAHARAQLQARLQGLDAPEGRAHRHGRGSPPRPGPADGRGHHAAFQCHGRQRPGRGRLGRDAQAPRAHERRRGRMNGAGEKHMRIGFIGLGVMGEPMARHLRAAGHDLAVWARRPESAAALVAEGVPLCATPAELAARSEVVITIVTASADVEALAFGPNGLAEGFAPGAIHVDMSTIAPATARSLAARYAELGIGWVDAPVSGGGQGARDATLAIMAGAEDDTLARVRPLFEVLGKRIVHIGPPCAGQVAQACNQMIMVSTIQACAEAVRLANAHGVDVAAVRQALMGGSAGSKVLEVMGAKMVERDFAAGIEARLHHKDFAILMAEAARLGAPLTVAAQAWQQLNALMGAGWGREDTLSLLRRLDR